MAGVHNGSESRIALASVLLAVAVVAAVLSAPARASASPPVAKPDGVIPSQVAKLLASDGVAPDSFGDSIALSSDTMVVGAPRAYASGHPESGAVYVFTRSGSGWTQQQKITASDGSEGDRFGWPVALSGDTVMIGAYYNANAAGAVYVFTRTGTTWTQQAKLVQPDGITGHFGSAVAISGDTAVIGAFLANGSTAAGSGAAYVFSRSGTSWTEKAKLSASDGAMDDGFGTAVAISGSNILVGASGCDVSGKADAGAAYAFKLSGITWAERQKLVASDGLAGDFFGTAVAAYGDWLVIGAYGDDIDSNADQGSTYVFEGIGPWSQWQKIVASDGAAGDCFGKAVAVSGNRLVVRASDDDIGSNADQGSAYSYVWGGSTWAIEQKLTSSEGHAADYLGHGIGLDGDTIVLTAPGEYGWMGAVNVFAPYSTPEGAPLRRPLPGPARQRYRRRG